MEETIPALGHNYNYIHYFTPPEVITEDQTKPEPVEVIKLCANGCGLESSEEHTATYKSGVWTCDCGEKLKVSEL